MTEKLYNEVWLYTTHYKNQFAGEENPAVAILSAMLEEDIVQNPQNAAEVRELYDCIDSALKYGEELNGGKNGTHNRRNL